MPLERNNQPHPILPIPRLSERLITVSKYLDGCLTDAIGRLKLVMDDDDDDNDEEEEDEEDSDGITRSDTTASIPRDEKRRADREMGSQVIFFGLRDGREGTTRGPDG